MCTDHSNFRMTRSRTCLCWVQSARSHNSSLGPQCMPLQTYVHSVCRETAAVLLPPPKGKYSSVGRVKREHAFGGAQQALCRAPSPGGGEGGLGGGLPGWGLGGGGPGGGGRGRWRWRLWRWRWDTAVVCAQHQIVPKRLRAAGCLSAPIASTVTMHIDHP